MTEAAIQRNIKRIEDLIGSVKRPGVDKLMKYMRGSDMYTAPASTRFHQSCKGGLLQHSLNVYDVLMSKLAKLNTDEGTMYAFYVNGVKVAEFNHESLIIASLLHDLCKTNFYQVVMKWRKDDNNKWEQYETYEVNDKVPYGHGEKSAMMASEFIHLTQEEMFAIRWHMGMSDCTQIEIGAYNQACEKFPLVHLVHCADQEASHYMEQKDGNKQEFIKAVNEELKEGSADTEWQEAPEN